MNKEFDYLFKIVLIGDAGVGKSSVLMRFADDVYQESYLATLGVDFKFKSLKVNKKNIKLQIWDTAGQERFRTITNVYFKNSNAIILTYDITSKESFQNLKSFWIDQVHNHADEGIELILMGNKLDLQAEKQVDQQEVDEFASQNNMMHFEVSAKTSKKVNEAFHEISAQLIKYDNMLQESDAQQLSNQKKKSGCC